MKEAAAFKELDFRAVVSICIYPEGVTPASAPNSSVGKSSRRQQPQSSYSLLVRSPKVSKAITSDESVAGVFSCPRSQHGVRGSVEQPQFQTERAMFAHNTSAVLHS